MSQNNNNDGGHKWITAIISISTPLFVAAMSGLTAWIARIDERQYTINQEYVSKAELKQTINNLSQLIEARRQEQVQSNQQILSEIRDTNATVQRLAIQLERRTKTDE